MKVQFRATELGDCVYDQKTLDSIVGQRPKAYIGIQTYPVQLMITKAFVEEKCLVLELEFEQYLKKEETE